LENAGEILRTVTKLLWRRIIYNVKKVLVVGYYLNHYNFTFDNGFIGLQNMLVSTLPLITTITIINLHLKMDL